MPEIPGDVLKALAKLALPPEDALRPAQAHIHVRMDPKDPDRTIVEVTSGRAIVWVSCAEPTEDSRLIPRAHAQRFGKGEVALIDGAEIIAPFRVWLPHSVPDGARLGEDEIDYPELDPWRPGAAARLALEVDPKRTAALLSVLGAICSGDVEILLPSRRGGAVSLRGMTIGGDTVEATILPESLFGISAADATDEADEPEEPAAAPTMFDRDIGA